MSPFPKLVPRGVVCCLEEEYSEILRMYRTACVLYTVGVPFLDANSLAGGLLLKNADGVETPSACAYAAHFDRHAR
jgi:hypothetical protein